LDVVVAVEALADDGHEQRGAAVAGVEAAGVGEQRIDQHVAAGVIDAVQAAVGPLGDARERERIHALPSSAARATPVSSKGCRTPSISWYGSWPLPATSTMSPGPASPTARVIAARRSRSTTTAERSANPCMISATIASPSSRRGLSSVTITASARRSASPAI